MLNNQKTNQIRVKYQLFILEVGSGLGHDSPRCLRIKFIVILYLNRIRIKKIIYIIKIAVYINLN